LQCGHQSLPVNRVKTGRPVLVAVARAES